jgi:hypothetical protein
VKPDGLSETSNAFGPVPLAYAGLFKKSNAQLQGKFLDFLLEEFANKFHPNVTLTPPVSADQDGRPALLF